MHSEYSGANHETKGQGVKAKAKAKGNERKRAGKDHESEEKRAITTANMQRQATSNNGSTAAEKAKMSTRQKRVAAHAPLTRSPLSVFSLFLFLLFYSANPE